MSKFPFAATQFGFLNMLTTSMLSHSHSHHCPLVHHENAIFLLSTMARKFVGDNPCGDSDEGSRDEEDRYDIRVFTTGL